MGTELTRPLYCEYCEKKRSVHVVVTRGPVVYVTDRTMQLTPIFHSYSSKGFAKCINKL